MLKWYEVDKHPAPQPEDEFAKDNFGSVENAQNIIKKMKRDELVKEYKSRGYEIPEESEELEPLTFDDLYRAREESDRGTFGK